jgi:hypothetical protein
MARRRAYPVQLFDSSNRGLGFGDPGSLLSGPKQAAAVALLPIARKKCKRALLHLRVVPRTSSYDLARTATVRGGLV